ncbi:unnamed protein product [Calypogeia fissa]
MAALVESVMQNLRTHYHQALTLLQLRPGRGMPQRVKRIQLGEIELDLICLVTAVIVLLLSWKAFYKRSKKKTWNQPPTIPGGFPAIGNLMQLKEAKPHKTFTGWAAEHGPIFHVKLGNINNVVINSAELAREVMITKHNSVSTRRLCTALRIVNPEKTMVSMSDYDNDQYRMFKKLMVQHLVGPGPQHANRPIRENAINAMVNDLYDSLDLEKSSLTDVRSCIRQVLFPFAIEQVFGYVPTGVYVPELNQVFNRTQIFEAIFVAPLGAVTKVDLRDFFPAFRFVPNKPLENSVQKVRSMTAWIVDALIEDQKKLLAKRGHPTSCYADILLTQATHLTPLQLQMALWEPLVESGETSLMITEWTMYEIARNPQIQHRLYEEINAAVSKSDRIVTEVHLDRLPLLTAVVKESFRMYPPVPILPPRIVHEDTTLGGYVIPEGWDVLINIYGIQMDPKVWSNPAKWDPDRVLNDTTIDLGVTDLRIAPFGGGQRICSGLQQVMLIVPMMIATFVLHFHWSMPHSHSNDLEDRAAAEETVSLTTQKLHPLKAVATLRN